MLQTSSNKYSNHVHSNQKNKDLSNIKAAVKKGIARKNRIKLACTVLSAMFMMGGISLIIGVCDYAKRGLIELPWISFFVTVGIILCGVGFWLGIKGFQK